MHMKDRRMLSAQGYRVRSAEFARLAIESKSSEDIMKCRQREQTFKSLAENEDWVLANRDKIISNRASADGRIGHGVKKRITP